KSKSDRIDILIGGVGMVAMAFALGQALSEKKYDAVINIGIAGSFDKTIALGTVVRVHKDQISELGAEDDQNFLTIEDLGLGKSIYHERPGPFSTLPSVSKLKTVNSVTVNTVHGNQESIDLLARRLHLEVENMEGASVFYAAQQHGIHCLEIR